MGHTVRPRLRYAQNFLTDPALVERLLSTSSIGAADLVLEIGAGEGPLTAALARRCRAVTAFEIDPALQSGLRRRLRGAANVRICAGDFLEATLPSEPFKVFASIPFNRTAAIVRRLTQGARTPDDAYLVVQAEAAHRFAGVPRGTLVAAEIAPWFAVRIEHRFRREQFTPVPSVEVVLLRLTKRGPPLVARDEEQAYRLLTAAVFTAWEAAIAQALRRLGGPGWAHRVLELAEIEGELAPSAVPPTAWARLFHAYRALPSSRVQERLLRSQGRLNLLRPGKSKPRRPGMPASGPGPPPRIRHANKRCALLTRPDTVSTLSRESHMPTWPASRRSCSRGGPPSNHSDAGSPAAARRSPWLRAAVPVLLGAFALGAAACGSASASRQTPEPTVLISLVNQPHTARTAVAPPTPSPTVTPVPLAQQICLVSPSHGIPTDYVPPDLVTLPQGPYVGPAVQMRRTAAAALTQLLDGAADQKIYLFAVSGYRSAALQQQTLDNEIAQYGSTRAYSEVALPGHSEHQLGDAVDVLSRRDPVDMNDAFGTTPEGQWLAANAPAYGFVISYPQGKQSITGYVYEPWHIRYLGLQLAQQVTLSGLTLTEFLPLHGMDGCPLQNGLLDLNQASPTPAAPGVLPAGR